MTIITQFQINSPNLDEHRLGSNLSAYGRDQCTIIRDRRSDQQQSRAYLINKKRTLLLPCLLGVVVIVLTTLALTVMNTCELFRQHMI